MNTAVAIVVALRIISITPATTEIACALGLTDNLVAVSTYCNYPPEIAGKERVGSFSDPNLEKILSLKPDFVLATGLEQAQAVRKLKRLGLKVICVDPKNFEELFASIMKIGGVSGRSAEAADLVRRMKASIKEVRDKAGLVPAGSRPKIYFEIWGDPLITAGKGSFIDEMITIAGGANIAYDTSRAYSIFSPELVVERDPDAIILGYMAAGGSAVESISKRMGWDRIKAVRNGRVYDDIDPDILLRPGPRLVKGLQELHERIYR